MAMGCLVKEVGILDCLLREKVNDSLKPGMWLAIINLRCRSKGLHSVIIPDNPGKVQKNPAREKRADKTPEYVFTILQSLFVGFKSLQVDVLYRGTPRCSLAPRPAMMYARRVTIHYRVAVHTKFSSINSIGESKTLFLAANQAERTRNSPDEIMCPFDHVITGVSRSLGGSGTLRTRSVPSCVFS
ncbi:hypothetical protein BD410DRAFT_826433 [Rickenella mellea]|uniref:Uncharacterized protein n=1 Tax=Rickenella mellea TaxID=50990 RepID=A0A4Y7QE15_9AGAM|nr:hypothetical protein BD410DRAFT_826433 [Rickenella mellea]